MSILQWRQFNFFDKQQVHDPNDPTHSPTIFQLTNITASTSGRGHIIIGDAHGYIHIVDKHFQVTSFQAYGPDIGDGGHVSHLKQLKQRNILVSIGEEDPLTSVPTLKLWDLDPEIPMLLRVIKIIPSPNSLPYPVSAFAILENLTQLAIGLANGVVIYIKGDLARDRMTKQRIIHESDEPITALGFREVSKSVYLLVVTLNKVLSYNTAPNKPEPTLLEERGAGLDCAVMSESTGEMIVGRDDAIYFYDISSRVACFAYETPKTYLSWFKTNYLIIMSPPTPTFHVRRPSSFGGPNSGSAFSSTLSSPDLTKLIIFDTTHKFIAYIGSFPMGIKAVICEWGSIFVSSMDDKLYRLDEKDTPTKLDILFRKNLYLLAINLAHSSKYDDTSVAEIFRRYGDFLYRKADYDGAMTQYIHTIGKLEPSYVIRKFLDAQRIYNLTSYLQELHSKALANPDHTTLLLNCYTKLKDVARLDSFIKTDSELKFDLDTAIKVCRQAGYFDHAVYLAEKFSEHDMYLDIIIEDMKDFNKALEYLRKLSPSEAGKHLQKYGKTLLTYLPEKTTSLLIDLCSGSLSPSPVKHPGTPDSQLQVLQTFTVLPFASVPSNAPSPTPSTHAKSDKKIVRPQLPSPRAYMSLFVDLPDCLITFLESVFEKRWGFREQNNDTNPVNTTRSTSPNLSRKSSGSDSNISRTLLDEVPQELSDPDVEERKSIWNTLLELYLMDEKPHVLLNLTETQPAVAKPTLIPTIRAPSISSDRELIKKRRKRREKALKLLRDPVLDTNHALVLCHRRNFQDGIVYLYERMKLFGDVLRFWMERGETEKVIESLRKYGPQDPTLYPLTLTYFSSTHEILSQSTSELLSVLNSIDSQNLLPPLQVIQALSRNSVASVGLVKGYLVRRIENLRKATEEDQALLQSYREESEKKKKEIEELKTGFRVFQVTRCSACNQSLDLPAFHFLCRHSYHQRCLPDPENVCPKCVTQNLMIAEVRRTQEANANKHDLFLTQLEDSDDGFDVIAEYFSKNTMSFTKITDSEI